VIRRDRGSARGRRPATALPPGRCACACPAPPRACWAYWWRDVGASRAAGTQLVPAIEARLGVRRHGPESRSTPPALVRGEAELTGSSIPTAAGTAGRARAESYPYFDPERAWRVRQCHKYRAPPLFIDIIATRPHLPRSTPATRPVRELREGRRRRPRPRDRGSGSPRWHQRSRVPGEDTRAGAHGAI
jgi:hypothetical protein